MNPADFLHSLIRHIAATASLAYASGTPRALWRNQIIEAAGGTAIAAADPSSWLLIYGGPAQNYEGLPRFTVQCGTRGASADLALARAQKIYEALLESTSSYPHQRKTINGYKAADDTADGTWTIVSIDFLQRPGAIGLDAKDRQQFVFNFEVAFFKAS